MRPESRGRWTSVQSSVSHPAPASSGSLLPFQPPSCPPGEKGLREEILPPLFFPGSSVARVHGSGAAEKGEGHFSLCPLPRPPKGRPRSSTPSSPDPHFRDTPGLLEERRVCALGLEGLGRVWADTTPRRGWTCPSSYRFRTLRPTSEGNPLTREGGPLDAQRFLVLTGSFDRGSSPFGPSSHRRVDLGGHTVAARALKVFWVIVPSSNGLKTKKLRKGF